MASSQICCDDMVGQNAAILVSRSESKRQDSLHGRMQVRPRVPASPAEGRNWEKKTRKKTKKQKNLWDMNGLPK